MDTQRPFDLVTIQWLSNRDEGITNCEISRRLSLELAHATQKENYARA